MVGHYLEQSLLNCVNTFLRKIIVALEIAEFVGTIL